MKLTTATLLTSSLISLFTGSAHSRGECKKWNTELSICDTSPSLCNNGTQTSDPTFWQTRTYFNYLYVDYGD